LDTQHPKEKFKDIYNKDAEYKNYFYMQSNEDKEIHLRELWIKTRQKRLESSTSQAHKIEFTKINKEISDLIRSVRRQIDKYLLNNNLPPYFGNNIRFYDKEEFLFDAEINFYQIKKFLNVKSSILENDETIAKDYLELMETITRKKLMETSIAKYEKPEFYSKDDETLEKEEENEIKLPENETDQQNMLKSTEYMQLFEAQYTENEGDSKQREKKLKEKLLSHFETQMKKAYGKQLEKDKAEDREKLEAEQKGNKKKKVALNPKEAKNNDKKLRKKDKEKAKTKK
jgi:hypothetical protein